MSYMINGLARLKAELSRDEKKTVALAIVNACGSQGIFTLVGTNITAFASNQLKPLEGDLAFQLVRSPDDNTAEDIIPSYYKGMDQRILESGLTRIREAVLGVFAIDEVTELILCFTDAGDSPPVRSMEVEKFSANLVKAFQETDDWPEVCFLLSKRE